MFRLTTISVIAFLLFAGSLCAQQDSEFGYYVDSNVVRQAEKFRKGNIIIKTNPLAIVSGEIPLYSAEFRLLGEYVTGPRTGVVLGASYLGMGLILRSALDADSINTGYSSWDYGFNGFRLQGGFRYYIKKPGVRLTDPDFKPAPGGFYVMGLVSYSNAKYYLKQYPNEYYRFNFISYTLNVGVQFLLGDKLVLDPYWGLGYKQNQVFEVINQSSRRINDPDLQDDFIFGSNLKINIGINMGFRF
ncbi:hypothetical protein KFE98_18825 [bacterium SCSIO 12741]|nr:hypothetical protein KFE98_18825 [bacterium SCSIO 12741]